MDNVSRIAKNTLILNAATIVNNLIAMVISIGIARVLGASGLGRFAVAFAFVGMFAVLADLGLSTLVMREVARSRTEVKKYLGSALIIKLFLGIITFLIIFLAANLTQKIPPALKIAVYLAAGYAILESLGKLFSSVFNAFERMEFTALLQFLLKVLTLVGVLIALYRGYGVAQVVGAYLLAGVIYVVIGFLLLGKKISFPSFGADFPFWKSLLKKSIPLAVAAFLVGITNNIDMTILSFLKGDVACGLYSAARRMMAPLIFIPANFTLALFPLFSRLYKTDKVALIRYHQKAFQFLFLMAFPLAVGTTLLAGRFMPLIWSADLAKSALALKILIWALVGQFVTTLFASLLVAIDKQKLVAWISFWAMLVSVLLNFIFIPLYSYQGASIARLLTAGFILGVYSWYIWREGYGFNALKIIFKPLLAALGMGLSLYLLKGANLALLVGLGVVVYTVLLFLLRTFSEGDFRLAKQLFTREK